MINRKTDTYYDEDDFIERNGQMEELTVTVTLHEYRDLIRTVEEYENRIEKLEEEKKTLEEKVESYSLALRCPGLMQSAAATVEKVLAAICNEAEEDAESAADPDEGDG